ncbi:Alpha-(1,6)-fucosyltransferase [Rhizophlyctis rosea]|nr:Alpha-(1,6)-fucosyltransferase [Rhizophlyctis rosea]
MAWEAPVGLLATQPGGSETTTPPPGVVSGEATSEEEAARQKVILAAVLTSVGVLLILGILVFVFFWRKRENGNGRSKYAKLDETTSRSVAAAPMRQVTIDRTNTKKYRLRTPTTRDVPAATSDERYIDPTRNVVIPLLAPVPTDGGNLGDGPWEGDPRASGRSFKSASDIIAIQDEIGDLSRVALEAGGTGGAGMDTAALPKRGESQYATMPRNNTIPRKPVAYEKLAELEGELQGGGSGSGVGGAHGSLAEGVGTALAGAVVGAAVAGGAAQQEQQQDHESAYGSVMEEARYVVVYPHFPRMSDEVELVPGDIVSVKKIYKDGWCRGINLNTNKTGVFPLFAVEDDSWEGNSRNVHFVDVDIPITEEGSLAGSVMGASEASSGQVTESSRVTDTSMMKAGYAAAFEAFGTEDAGVKGKGKGKGKAREEVNVSFVMPPVEKVGRESLDERGADEPALIDVERASPKAKKKAQLL